MVRCRINKLQKNHVFFNNVSIDDCILVDRGFNIKEELITLGATLKIPSFTKRKRQLSSGEVDTSRQLSSVRIDVDCVIGRIEQFRLLQTKLPLTQVDLLYDIIVFVCDLVNIDNNVVPI